MNITTIISNSIEQDIRNLEYEFDELMNQITRAILDVSDDTEEKTKENALYTSHVLYKRKALRIISTHIAPLITRDDLTSTDIEQVIAEIDTVTNQVNAYQPALKEVWRGDDGYRHLMIKWRDLLDF